MAITSSVQAFKQSPQIREHTNQILQQTAQQRPDLSPELLDNAKLSDEFIDEVGKMTETQGYDPNMLAALAGNFLDHKASGQGGDNGQGAGEAKKAEKVGDGKPKKAVEAKWEPMIRAGEVIPKQGKLGEVTTKITTYPADEDDKKDDKKAEKARTNKAPSQVQGPQAAAGSQKTGGANQAPKTEQNESARNDEKDEKVEFSQETKEMLNQLHSQGMKTPGLDPNQGGAQTSQESKPVGAAKGAGAGPKKPTVTEKTDELFMPSEGLTQAVKVRERGEIKNGDVILRYRKLDDLPSGSVAILKHKTGKEGLDEYARRIQEGDKVPALSKEQQRQLLEPIAEK
ncbi:MAG: hypothetical protein U0931_06745 [Vulcanimicrobiota bacterium]